MKRGEHLQVIKDKIEELISTFDNSGYQDLQHELESTVLYITKSKYEKIQMKDNLPQGFFRKDKNLIPFELLSTGTKDVLGLALRLAMAKYFLQNAHTFLILFLILL
jgi:DNA repair exonuclease SbcCD ATPase subunit